MHGHAPEFIAEIATLAGIRDTWVRSSPRWEDACIQAYALLFPPKEKFVGSVGCTLGGDWRAIMWAGRIQYEKSLKTAKKVVRDAYRFTTAKGTRVGVFSGVRITSDAAEVDPSLDVVIGFDYYVDEGLPKMIVSMRSRYNYDCGALCKHFGGGGHMKAAGFNIPNPTLAPWAQVQSAVEAYEATLA